MSSLLETSCFAESDCEAEAEGGSFVSAESQSGNRCNPTPTLYNSEEFLYKYNLVISILCDRKCEVVYEEGFGDR